MAIGEITQDEEGKYIKRFLIGQFERFDIDKQNRDFRDCFWGIEATQMDTIQHCLRLRLKKAGEI